MGKIYIVAGHGQGDPGAIGNGYHEADLTRKMANDLYNRLKDKNIILYPTARDLYKSKDYNFFSNADYVLEIHFNSAANPSANGTELLIKQGFQPDSRDKAIYNSLTPFFSNRGIKGSNALANMNQFAKRGIAYSLLEVCFICNANDMSKFNQNYNTIINNLTKALGGSEVVSTPAPAPTPPPTVVDSWQKNSVGWWYKYKDGTWPASQWKMINGHWYHFDANGYMQTGWFLDKDNVWYYLDPADGYMKTGWIQVHKKWYWLKANGAMATGWTQVGGKWYFLNKNGDMKTGWLESNGNWYWLKEYGDMASDEVLTINKKDYVFAKSGYMRRTADMQDGKLN